MKMKLWENVECMLRTENTANNLPASRYFITQTAMARAAFVNAGPGRPADEVVWKKQARKVCYYAPGSDFASYYEHGLRGIRVHSVRIQGPDEIELTLTYKDGSEITVGGVYITPKVGYYVFDGLMDEHGKYDRRWHRGDRIIALRTGKDLKGCEDLKAAALAAAALYRFEAIIKGPLQDPEPGQGALEREKSDLLLPGALRVRRNAFVELPKTK